MRFLTILIFLAACGQPPAGEPVIESGTTRVSVADPAAGALRGGDWIRLGSWSGVGDQTTERFIVEADEWRIILAKGEGSAERMEPLEVAVHAESGRVVASLQLGGGAGDVGYIEEGLGRYYLVVEGDETAYTLTAEELRSGRDS